MRVAFANQRRVQTGKIVHRPQILGEILYRLYRFLYRLYRFLYRLYRFLYRLYRFLYRILKLRPTRIVRCGRKLQTTRYTHPDPGYSYRLGWLLIRPSHPSLSSLILSRPTRVVA